MASLPFSPFFAATCRKWHCIRKRTRAKVTFRVQRVEPRPGLVVTNV